MKFPLAVVSCLLGILLLGAGEARSQPGTEAGDDVRVYPNREAFFGDLHVHTSWSTDAYTGGNRVGPREAYRFARGEAVELPSGLVTQLQTPLDFVALTDHAEGFDTVGACFSSPDHGLYDSAACRALRGATSGQAAQGNFLRAAFERGAARPAPRDPALCGDVEACLDAARSTWQRVQEVANEFDQPGRFTALIGYEFSALLRDFGMLHRNVIFRGEDVIPHAISSLDVKSQADFFSQLDDACEAPCQVLTIPHNTNYSWGLTFSRTDEDGSSYTAADLERRARIERLVEVTQLKGTSECQVGVGAADEDCNFGILFPPCEEDQFGRCARPASFVRNALLDGIELQSSEQANPFKLGLIGSTDTHQSDPGYFAPEGRSDQRPAIGNAEATARLLERSHVVVGPIRKTNVGGLAGVWAESNTRAHLFDAMRRRETFATTGSRLRVRFFAGDLPADIGSSQDDVARAYASGVPMGSDLVDVANPRFWVWAVQDPVGPALDRIQVIKGWIEEGEQRHEVRDVVCSGGREPDESGRCAPTAATVDLSTCERSDETGAAELQTAFSDPGFDADQAAFYYVRVLENPQCRWTTHLANAAGLTPPPDVPATAQQRGWSSPIWVRGAKETSSR